MNHFKIPSFFILFLTFSFLWIHQFKKQQKKYDSSKNAFWKREQESLIVRKKEIPHELYFKPNIRSFRFPKLNLNSIAQEKYQRLIRQIKNSSSLPMLNFHDLSNTDLRLQFGTANQSLIAQAEENYDAFLSFLYEYALLMKEQEHYDESALAMEEAIRLKSDISKHFMLLGDLYLIETNTIGIQRLLTLARELNTPTKTKIIQYLENLIY